MVSVEIPNGSLKQYYYNVIKLRSKTMNEFMKGVVCLGLAAILFLLADYFQINNFKDLF